MKLRFLTPLDKGLIFSYFWKPSLLQQKVSLKYIFFFTDVSLSRGVCSGQTFPVCLACEGK